jgi:GntR family transcriptional repressor for pyruvate dehydrogenase complex
MESILDLFNDGSLTLNDFSETRRAIECLSAANAAKKITAEDIEELRIINSEFLSSLEDPSFLAEVNLKFHSKIADISGNPLNKLMIVAITKMMSVMYSGAYQSPEFIKQNHEQHNRIINALEQQDPETAQEEMGKDIKLTLSLSTAPDFTNSF